MGNGSSFLPTEQDSALLSDTTLAALKSLPEDSQQELAALYKLREMAEPEVVEVSTPRVAPVESAAAAAVETPVEAAKAAFEAALEEADEDQDKVVALAEAYSNCYATALLKTPGALPPEGFYTNAESIFQALMPLGDGGIAPVKLLSSKWIKDRAAKLKAATTDDERRKLRLPRRQDLERDEPEAFMSVERLKQLPRGHGGFKDVPRLQAAASSYCWLTPAHPDPLGEQLVSLAEAIEKAEKEGRKNFPSEAAIFIDFGSLCQKDPNLWVPCCGGPTYKPPEARTAEEAAAADAYEASRTGEEREAFGVALSSMQIWYVHPMLTAFLTRTLPEGYESIAGYEEVRHTPWLTPPLLTPCLLTPLPSSLSVVGQPANRRGSRSPRWMQVICAGRPSLTLSAPSRTAGRRRLLRRRWRGSSLVSASRRRRAICRWSSRSTRGRSSPSFET